ncbi:unnamed protein product [Tetraodon nigroviridis]|uniref:Ubiquitin carboxyl-terminal hydrolase n=1 Tax=Tetraodon nigroviridis TaxID=99883 RepID=Q4S433_TETNG|nr:unnamed protein product [Tetraodon nigroviridis]
MDNQISKYHGLINQGATCYLNSLLQVLYMTADFKLAVERFSQENPDSRSIDHELNDLFNHLKTEEARTDDITKALSIDKVFEQRDAAEYFERILLLANPSASKIFNGILTHRNTCSSCQTETETDSKFWHLPLALVNSDGGNYRVSDGVNELFEASAFFGDDQIYCDSCCAKSDFEIKCVMKQHPDVLLLLLKRFELDYSVMRYIKNNCNVDVPWSLQIPDTNQTYKLYAVINHDGDIRYGHYTATIRDDENWHHFNDQLVTLNVSISCHQFSAQKFQCLSSFLQKTEWFIGDDQIYCDSCCAKSDFEIKCVMKQHPDVLLLLLKRFELDYSVMRYIKNNCNVDVPWSLQIPDTNQTYKLYAVINHDGDIRYGHYTATIRDDENWHHFNDQLVTQIARRSRQLRVPLTTMLPFSVEMLGTSMRSGWWRECVMRWKNQAQRIFTVMGVPGKKRGI